MVLQTKSNTRFISLSTKLGLFLLVWALGLLLFVSVTVSVTWKLEDRGAAMNVLGNVQSASLYLSNVALQNAPPHKIDAAAASLRRLADDIRSNSVLCCVVDDDSVTLHDEVTALTMLAQAAEVERNKSVLWQQTEHLSRRAAVLSQQIEQQNTASIALLRGIRLGLVALIVLSALLCFFFLKKWVLKPLAVLNSGMMAIKSGQMSHRIRLASRDEFESAAQGFNQMASELQNSYCLLEAKVLEKTRELERQKQDWEALYQLTSLLHQQDFNQSSVNAFLHQVLRVGNLASGCVFFIDRSETACTLAEDELILPEAELLPVLQEYARSHSQAMQGQAYFLCDDLDLPMRSAGHWLVVPIRHLNVSRAFLFLFYPKERRIHKQDLQLLEMLGAQLAVSQENARLHGQQRQNAVLEERNLIAQSLHDSIAQSLSFLNMQFGVLQKQLSAADAARLRQNIDMIHRGIQGCYQDVRLLLGNYRSQFDNGNFETVLRDLVQRYRRQYRMEIELLIVSEQVLLSDDAQIQVVFILQEALANSYQHAKASQVSIMVDGDDGFEMSVRDNGCGFCLPAAASDVPPELGDGHFGLRIMAERAAKIGGQLSITSSPENGTHIVLTLPAARQGTMA